VPDIQHSAIPDGQRHEPKGISTAASGQVYVANGTGSGAWTSPKGVIEFTAVLTPASIGANTTVEQSFTFTGILTTDKLMHVVKPTYQTNLGIVGARIISNNTVGITYIHIGGSSITPTSETYSVTVWR
jgi:hypothetical protein